MAKQKSPKRIETITHADERRLNIPTAEHQSVMSADDQAPVQLRYPRNPDLDPQLVWRGKDAQDDTDLTVNAPPLYIQEKVHPKVLLDDLAKQTKDRTQGVEAQIDLFSDFNGIPDQVDKTEFYRHEQNWTNRMILGDSLKVMGSLAEREALRGKVQMIYLDPPYGIKFNSNFQWSTTSRDVKDGKADHITREPEQVKAFRDTWRDGIHSYLSYLRDRLIVARDLLTDSGSIFVQIGDENVHRVRALMDELFGEENTVALIAFKKTSGAGSIAGGTDVIPQIFDYVIWYSKSLSSVKYRQLFREKVFGEAGASQYQWIERSMFHRRRMTKSERENEFPEDVRIFGADNLTSASGVDKTRYPVVFEGRTQTPHPSVWKTSEDGMNRLIRSRRIIRPASNFSYVRFIDDFPAIPLANFWDDTASSFMADKVYVVQTNLKIVQRCLLMTTDPGDLVLDPTCGSGTTAYVAEQWGRRWITIDTSRVALALARARIMGARYPYYLLADSDAGRQKESEVTRSPYIPKDTYGNIRHGFVYERVPHITLKSIANNAEIDVLYEEHQPAVLAALANLNAALRGHGTPFKVTTGGRTGKKIDFTAAPDATFTMPSGEEVSASELVEWEVPREKPGDWPAATAEPLERFWQARIARQKAIDVSIAAKAESEYLYDKPYEDKGTVRVAGPFTVESLSPHRTMIVAEDDSLIDPVAAEAEPDYLPRTKFDDMILENLRTAGVQQTSKGDRITFTALTGWPGDSICAEGVYQEGDATRRAGIFIGPEFGTVGRADLVMAAREAGDAGFDVVIACAFNYDAHATEFSNLGPIRVLKARMNADLHMAEDLKNTGKGNLFVIFGEPDIEVESVDSDELRVHIHGVDVFDPSSGEVRSDSADGIAVWFVDTDYNGESFFVRQAYFLGADDPYKSLKTSLKAEIDEDAWATLNSAVSRPFERPSSGRIAVKVINHLGDEVMKVVRV
jgi:adenine-specific DNA-methyltransferase